MKDKPPYVTVAMITYNHEAFVMEAVQSILKQTYCDFELVIVDDGSTDGTGKAIRSVSDERVSYIWQENRGPSEARNTALRAARGAIIAQMSGDDVAEPTRLERQIEANHENPHSVIFSRCTFIGDDGNPIDVPRLNKVFNRPNWSDDATLRHLFFRGNCFLAPSALATKKAFNDVGSYKPYLLQVQDYDMWLRFILKGYHTYVIQEPLLRYRIRADNANLSADTPAVRFRSHFERCRVLREFLAIGNAERLVTVFPEVRAFGYPMNDDLVPFLLAIIALQTKPPSSVLRHFGANLLMDLMENPATRTALLEKAGVGTSDFSRILGQAGPLDVELFKDLERLQRRVESLQAHINDLLQSRTWRMTWPLRVCVKWLRKLFSI